MMYHKPKIELIHSENNGKTNNCSRGRGKAGNTCKTGSGRKKPANSCMDGGNLTEKSNYGNACGQGG